MTTTDLLTAAELEFGAAQLVVVLVGVETRDTRTFLEVKNPAVDLKWRRAATVAKVNKDGQLRLDPPPNPSDPSDWRRAERLA